LAIIANSTPLADHILSLLLSMNPASKATEKERKKNTKFTIHESVWICDETPRTNRNSR